MKKRHYMSRRVLLRMGGSGLLSLGLWPGSLSSADSSPDGDYHFIVVNDLHYIDVECGAWLEKATRQMAAHPEQPEFCLILGDLTEYGRARDFGAVKDIFEAMKIPFYSVMGNHDYQATTDRHPYETHFPDRLNYHFEHRGWQFVGLDTTDGQKYNNTKVSDATLRWLQDHQSDWDRHRPTIVFTHFPLGPEVNYRPANTEAVLEPFKPFNLQAVFCGHWHGFTKRVVGTTMLTTDRCCALKRANHDGTKEKGYFLCHAKDGTVSYTFCEVKPGQ